MVHPSSISVTAASTCQRCTLICPVIARVISIFASTSLDLCFSVIIIPGGTLCNPAPSLRVILRMVAKLSAGVHIESSIRRVHIRDQPEHRNIQREGGQDKQRHKTEL